MERREKRKLDRRQKIHNAAVSLARDSGIDAATVDAICLAAGVSQRTFFNYFPFKEAVFVFPPPPLPKKAVAHFVASRGDLSEDIIDLMVAQAKEMMASPWLGPLMRKIAEAYPRLMPLQMAEFHKFELELQTLIAGRLGTDVDDIRALALASAVSGASRTAISRRRLDPSADLTTAMRETLEALFKMLKGEIEVTAK